MGRTDFELLYRDHDIALLVSMLNIPVRLGSLFQRKASVDNRFNLPRLNQRFDNHEEDGAGQEREGLADSFMSYPKPTLPWGLLYIVHNRL